MATWAAMFTSRVFRLLMKTWGFFIVTSAVPMVLLIVILLLALYSWWHLDLGLAEYCEYRHHTSYLRCSNVQPLHSESRRTPSSCRQGSMVTRCYLRSREGSFPFIGKGKYGTTGHMGSPSSSNRCQTPAGGAKSHTKSFEVLIVQCR